MAIFEITNCDLKRIRAFRTAECSLKYAEFEITNCDLKRKLGHKLRPQSGAARYPPFVFNEQGVVMLSSVLNSKRAVEVNIQIMRVFVKMRQLVINYAELLQRIEALETEQVSTNGHIAQIYNLIKELLEPEFKNRKPIGFHASDNG